MLDAGRYMPHEPPMRLVDRIESVSDTHGRAEAYVAEDNPYVSQSGTLEPVTFVEMIAQSFAAWQGVQAEDDAATGGMLVSVSAFDVTGDAYQNDTLEISVELATRVPPFFMVDGTVSRNGDALASASLRVVSQ